MALREFSSGGIVMKWQGHRPMVLLIKDSYGRWTWPKGNINEGESSVDAAIREIGEEAGLKNIEVINKLGKTEYFYRMKGQLIFKTVYLYLFRFRGKEKLKILQDEIRDGRWFPAEKALDAIEYRGAKDFLRKGIEIFQKIGK